MLSVMVPENICLPGAAGSTAIARRLKIRGFGVRIIRAMLLPGIRWCQAKGNRHFITRPGEPRDKVNVPITSLVSVSRTVSIIVV